MLASCSPLWVYSCCYNQVICIAYCEQVCLLLVGGIAYSVNKRMKEQEHLREKIDNFQYGGEAAELTEASLQAV